MSKPDAFKEMIHMYDRLAKAYKLQRELSEAQAELIELLKKNHKTSTDLINYSNILDKIDDIQKAIENHLI